MSTTKPSNTIDYGRGKAARIRQMVHELLLAKDAAGEIPTNSRFIFYELEQRGDATKPTRSGTTEGAGSRREKGWPPGSVDIADGIKWLRDEEREHIPWGWIADETRHLTEWSYADTVADYLRDALPEATINPWRGEAPPLILCEAVATAGVLRSAVSRYCCPITGTKGFCNGFLRNKVVPLFEGVTRQVLYLGDLDRSGLEVEAHHRELLGSPRWRRLAMTEKQSKKITPIWKVDGRDKQGRWAWEVESLGQRQLVQIVTKALDKMLPEPLERVLVREAQQRTAARTVLEGLGA